MWTRTAEAANKDSQQMRDIFLAEMDQLLLPAYLLTGLHEQAADCFLEAAVTIEHWACKSGTHSHQPRTMGDPGPHCLPRNSMSCAALG